MSKSSKERRKLRKRGLLEEKPRQDLVRCSECGYEGPMDEIAVIGQDEKEGPLWVCTPINYYYPDEKPRPVCIFCAFEHEEKHRKQFPWWFKNFARLPKLAKTLEVWERVRTMRPWEKPPETSESGPKPKKVHPLDKLKAKAESDQVSDDQGEITCSVCGCEVMEVDKCRCTPIDRKHLEVGVFPICHQCASDHSVMNKVQELFPWYFKVNRFLPFLVSNRELMAQYRNQRKSDEAEQDRRMRDFAERYHITEDSSRVCRRCKRHHGQVYVANELPFRKRMTLVSNVLTMAETTTQMMDNLCCQDCQTPDDQTYPIKEVKKNIREKEQTLKVINIRDQFLPRGVKDGTARPWGSAARVAVIRTGSD